MCFFASKKQKILLTTEACNHTTRFTEDFHQYEALQKLQGNLSLLSGDKWQLVQRGLGGMQTAHQFPNVL